MELTTEQKARVFAMYYGSQFTDEGWKETRAMLYPTECPDTVKLVLRPLSAITDEDAIEVGRLIGFDKEKYQKINGRAFCLNMKATPPVQFHHLNTHFAIQFLIQRGYAVPLFIAPSHTDNGKTAIELGLAIDFASLPL